MNFRLFIMGQLMAESGNYRIVKRPAKGTKDIGDNHTGKPGTVFFSPLLEYLPAIPLGAAIFIIPLLLGGRGKNNMRF